MTLGIRTTLLATVVALVAGLVPWSGAAAAGTTALGLAAAPAYAGTDTDLVVTLADDAGPVAGAAVVLERRTGGAWAPVATVATDAEGRARVPIPVARTRADNRVRASYAGDAATAAASAETTLPIKRRATRVTIAGPRRVVDERSITLRVRWRTGAGEPVAGSVRVQRRVPGGSWRRAYRVRTDTAGLATLRVTPRRDTRWRAVAPRLAWVRGDRSGVLEVDNRPPGDPVRLPRSAPSPRVKLPAQRRAVGDGAHLVVRRISERTWRSMVGRSWHRGCPVGRGGLRVVQVNYWDYQGYRRRGEIVANADAAAAMGGALAEMYRRQLPIRAMYRVDRFGWSKRVRGGDDYRSMAAGNTSAFNCRDVVGRPGRRSPHSWGRSLDLNTWENPYRSAQGIVPNRYWQPRSHPRVAWRSHSHPVVRLMARHGLRWTYGHGDTHHFDVVGRGKRVALPSAGGPAPCRRFCD